MKNKNQIIIGSIIIGFAILILLLGLKNNLYPLQKKASEITEQKKTEKLIFIGHEFSPEWIFNWPEKGWEVLSSADVWSTEDMRQWKFIRALSFDANQGNLESLSQSYPNKLNEFMDIFTNQSSQKAGIGIYLMKNNNKWLVSDILTNTPASRSEIHIDDEVMSIQGVATSSLAYYSDVLKLLRGTEGSEVIVQIKNLNGETKKLKLKRETPSDEATYPTPIVQKNSRLPIVNFGNTLVAIALDNDPFNPQPSGSVGVWTSKDGRMWENKTKSSPFPKESTLFPQLLTLNNTLYAFIRTNSVHEDGQEYSDQLQLWHSSNGIQWSKYSQISDKQILGSVSGTNYPYFYIFNNKFFLKVNYAGDCCFLGYDFFSSLDGISWEKENSQPKFNTDYVSNQLTEFKKELWLLTDLSQGCGEGDDPCSYSESNTMWSTKDGANWIQHKTNLPRNTYYGENLINFKNKLYLVQPDLKKEKQSEPKNNIIWSSEDGTNWTREGNAPWWSPSDVSIIPF